MSKQSFVFHFNIHMKIILKARLNRYGNSNCEFRLQIGVSSHFQKELDKQKSKTRKRESLQMMIWIMIKLPTKIQKLGIFFINKRQ